MKKFLKDMFSGSDTSIKRVIAFLGFMFIGITMLLNSFQHESVKPSEELVDACKTIVLVCIAGNVAEKFLMRKSDKQESTEQVS
jgi:preprotein translocase subunit SecG